LRHWADGCTSFSEGRRAMEFATLKIHTLLPGLNPRTLGLMAGTLTTTPPRTTSSLLCSQELATGSCSEPDKCNPYH
jgi:hypothetical protein